MFTKGFDLSGFDSDQIKNLISKEENYGEDDYQTGILDKLKIKQKASVGKHSIANAWGCFKLAQVTGLRDEIYKHESVSEQLKTLYAKYLICYNDTYTKDKLIDLNSINCNGKRVLFIDDQADDGWSILMKNIFKSSGNGFMAIDSSKYKNSETKLFHDYDGFYSECQQQIGKEWDLIIIDLRLNPEKEDIDNEMISPSDFSGYKLIDEFLNENEGYQIIVSTASNKIWNINAALKRGASSYYIKESPEFNYSISSTKTNFDNFKNEVQKCFDRKYLRDIYKSFYLAKSSAGNTNSDFMSESNTMLDIAWSIIRHEKLDFSFLTLFQIVESFTNSKYDYHDNGVIIVGKKQFMIEEKTGKFEWKLTFNRDNKKGDYFSSGIELKENKMSVNNLFKTSCVLSFVFKKDDNYLKRLGELNEIRHKIAHKGAKKFAAYNDIKDVLEIIKLIRDVI
jgi:CheY-like chemotaxis protein